MRFELELPWGSTLVYGLDTAAGIDWFGELIENEKVVDSYDAHCSNYDHARPLRGLLAWLAVTSELWDEEDLNETLERLIHQRPDELPDHLRVLGQIVENLRVAADHG